jgi:glycosyltransferase involved in cell wall biosynthesis
MQLSVIICCHNPRVDYLTRVLESLKAQTFSTNSWELLAVDNASESLVAASHDISWHPNARHIREENLGLTCARLRGVAESSADSVVFVDDDNVLGTDYLATAVRLLQNHPWLGAIGGKTVPEYEVPPPEWLGRYERLLAIRYLKRARWSNAVDDWDSQPWGAGMVVRRSICEIYVKKLSTNFDRCALDRKGTRLTSAGDIDLVLGCLDVGLGFGTFPELVVTHLIPEQRMTEEYIAKITRALIASNLWLSHLRGDPIQFSERPSFYTHLRGFYHFLKRSSVDRRYAAAVEAGQQDFQAMLKSQKQTHIQ